MSAARLRIPLSTYRLQLQPKFGFADAARVVPYLARLGVGDCYVSPWFRTRPGSTHGYDVCDYGELNPELGSEADFAVFTAARARHGMGLVLDFVANHMAVEPMRNKWWRDVLQHGPASPFARFFDVDWDPVKPELRGKVLLPFLGDHYGRVLERGELALALEAGAIVVRYGTVDRPLDPRSLPGVLRVRLDELRAELGEGDGVLREFLAVVGGLETLPAATDPDPERIALRLRACGPLQERLAALLASSAPLRSHVERALREVNGTPGRPESFDALHELLEMQSYRLAYWKTAIHEINFRRFFDVNELVALRMDDPEVFAATHELLLHWIHDGTVTGLRLDHVDGLYDPRRYLERLQEAVLERRAARAAVRAPAEGGPPQPALRAPFYVVVEKILSRDESLPGDWPIHGTTGYEFLDEVNRLFVDPRGAAALERTRERVTGRRDAFAQTVYECKKLITETSLASELTGLAHELNRISERDRRTRDFTLDRLREALREVAACFPVYRTYVSERGASAADRAAVELALARARRRNPAMEGATFDFVREALLPGEREPRAVELAALQRFAMRFQQYTSPLQAKGVEDTACYRHTVLIALNEVGSDPAAPGSTPERFHAANRRRLERFPASLLATSTHDTKRGEDARARIDVLSEVPDEWRRRVAVWSRILAPLRATVDGEPAPDRNDEYLWYQTLIGCLPAQREDAPLEALDPELVARVRDYLLKAIKEAKTHTSWVTPNEAYDRAVAAFVEQSLGGPVARRFLAAFLPFQRKVARLGAVNSLAQLVAKLAAPGVPDFYQGSELWDLSLVDPDNRRVVDFATRERMLAELEPWLAPSDERAAAAGRGGEMDASARESALRELLASWPDGRIKLYVTASGLRLRRRLGASFRSWSLRPLEATGEHAQHVVAFARESGDEVLLAVVPRLCAVLTAADRPFPIGRDAWGDTRLVVPPSWHGRSFEDVLSRRRFATRPASDGSFAVAEVLGGLPVAVVVGGGGRTANGR